MVAALIPLLSFCHIALILWGLRLYKQRPRLSLAILIANLAAMAYNTLVVTIGIFIGEELLPEGVLGFRSLPSALLLPLLISVTFEMVRRTGLDWAQRRGLETSLWGLAFALIAFRLALLVFPQAILQWQFFLSGSQMQTILTLTFVMGFGLILYRQIGWPWAAIGAMAMFFGSAAPVTLFGPVISLVTELGFAFSLLQTERKLQRLNV